MPVGGTAASVGRRRSSTAQPERHRGINAAPLASRLQMKEEIRIRLGLLTLRSISERSFPVPCYSLAGLAPTTIGRDDAGVAWDASSRSGRFERLTMAISKLALFEFTLIG